MTRQASPDRIAVASAAVLASLLPACGGGTTAPPLLPSAPHVTIEVVGAPVVAVGMDEHRTFSWTIRATETAGAASRIVSLEDTWYDAYGQVLIGSPPLRIDLPVPVRGSVTHAGERTLIEWEGRPARVRFRAALVDAGGFAFEAEAEAAVVDRVPVPEQEQVPLLISPSHGALLDNGCNLAGTANLEVWDFEWSPVRGADSYHLYVQHLGAINPVIDAGVDTTTFHWESPGWIGGSEPDELALEGADAVGRRFLPFTAERTFAVEPVNTDCR